VGLEAKKTQIHEAVGVLVREEFGISH